MPSRFAEPGVNRALWILCAAYVVQGTGALGVIGAMDAIADTWSLTRPQVGWLITAFGLPFALLAPLLQISVVGRWPRRRQLLLGVTGFAVSAGGAALASGYLPLLLARAGMGASAALMSPVLGALGSSLVPPAQQGAALARVLLGLSLAAVAGTPAAAWVAHAAGPRWLFASVAGLAALTAVLLRLGVPAGAAVSGSRLATLRGFITQPRALAAFLVVFCITAGVFSFQAYLEPVVKALGSGAGGAPAAATALLVLGTAGVVGNAWVGWVSASQPADRLLTGATVALMLILLAMALSPPVLAAFYPLLALWAMATDVVWPTQQRRVVAFWPEHRGLALALTASFMFCGMGVGAALGGPVQARHGLAGLAALGTVWFLLALLMVAATARRRPALVEA